jgi:hypothetical protein
MSYRLTGPTCSEPGCSRPPLHGPLCQPHWALARATSRTPEHEPASVPPFDVLLSHGRAHRAESRAFAEELNAWLLGTRDAPQ